MVRPLRTVIVDGWYHVFGRGLERRNIFADDADRRHLLELFEVLHDRYRIRIHAYAMLDNHYHAILQTPEANLSRGMQWLHGSYSAWYNARHDRVGPLFQGRYRAILVENGAWAYALSLYVHLNPLRVAGLGLDKRGRMMEGRGFHMPTQAEVNERLKRLREYRWSSYRAYAGYEAAPSWLETGELLERAHGQAAQRQPRFRKDVQARLTFGVEAPKVERLRDAVAVGSVEFARWVRGVAVGKSLNGIADKAALRRRVTWQEVRTAIEGLKGEPWDRFADRRGDEGRDLFLWAARRFCGVTLSELGAAIGANHAAISVAIKRLDQRAANDDRVRQLQTRLTEMLNVAP
jgi:REP element-mobilizing transposase RayT